MKRIYSIFNSIIFRRVLVIFLVGFITRGLVNLVYDINVFKDYTTSISLIYYVFMACFSGFIHELPSISFNVFDLKLVRDSITTVVGNMPYFEGKVPNDMFTSNGNYTVDKISKDSSNLYFRRPSAGIVGLYGRDNSVVGNDSFSNPKHSLGNIIRSKFIWYGWIKNSGNFISYKEFKDSFNPRLKISIVEEFKNRPSKK